MTTDEYTDHLSDRIRQLEADKRALLQGSDEQRSEIARLRAECEALRALLREVSCVAITMLYDTHKADVLALFTVPELEEVTARTQHLQSQSVESIYRRGFDAARAAREGE